MVIKVRCRCGKGIKVRDSAAGKRVRCPECSKPVRIPEPVIEEFDEYGDDTYEDDPYDQPAAPPPRRRKPAASGKRPSKAKKKKSAGGGSKLPLLIGGGVAVAVLLIGGALYAIFGGGDSSDTSAVAANNPGQTPAATTPAQPAATEPTATEPPPSTLVDDPPPAATAPANTVAAANAGAEANQNSPPPTADPPMATPQTTATSGNQLWVVLSEFKEVPNPQSIGKAHQVNYRVVAGAPHQSGKAYVLYMGSSMGMMERFYEVPVEIQASGTVQIPSAIGMAGELRAYLALKKGRREWEPVSGEIAIGGQPTPSRRPPTVVEAAGAGAQGKALALANGRLEKARSRMAVVVDYVLQKKADMGQRYFLVVSGSGDNIEADVTMELLRATIGKKDQFGLAVMPGRSFPAGDLKVHVETRKSRIRREPGTVASNTVSVQR